MQGLANPRPSQKSYISISLKDRLAGNRTFPHTILPGFTHAHPVGEWGQVKTWTLACTRQLITPWSLVRALECPPSSIITIIYVSETKELEPPGVTHCGRSDASG